MLFSGFIYHDSSSKNPFFFKFKIPTEGILLLVTTWILAIRQGHGSDSDFLYQVEVNYLLLVSYSIYMYMYSFSHHTRDGVRKAILCFFSFF